MAWDKRPLSTNIRVCPETEIDVWPTIEAGTYKDDRNCWKLYDKNAELYTKPLGLITMRGSMARLTISERPRYEYYQEIVARIYRVLFKKINGGNVKLAFNAGDGTYSGPLWTVLCEMVDSKYNIHRSSFRHLKQHRYRGGMCVKEKTDCGCSSCGGGITTFYRDGMLHIAQDYNGDKERAVRGLHSEVRTSLDYEARF